VRINRIWYLGAYTKTAALASIFPRPEPPRGTRRNYRETERDRLWPNVQDGGTWYFVKWRQAGKKEIKLIP
jgi:hypothetical protein